MLPILFSDAGATSQDGSHSAIFRMQGPEGCDVGFDPPYEIPHFFLPDFFDFYLQV